MYPSYLPTSELGSKDREAGKGSIRFAVVVQAPRVLARRELYHRTQGKK